MIRLWVFVLCLICSAMMVSAQSADTAITTADSPKEIEKAAEKAADQAAEQAETQPVSTDGAQWDQTHKDWEQFASVTEKLITKDNASISALDSLREALVQWRSVFATERSQNADQIDAVKRQIDALGPKPTDGVEAPEISKQRAKLNNELADLEAPVKTASLAYSRADELIKTIDRTARDRQTKAMLRLEPTPLNPNNWAAGPKALHSTVQILTDEVQDWRSSVERRRATWDKMPLILFMLVFGIGSLTWARRKLRRKLIDLSAEDVTSGRWLAIFSISLLGFVLSLVGILAILYAFDLTGIFSEFGVMLLKGIALGGVVAATMTWIARRVFPSVYLRKPALELTSDERRAGRRYGLMIGIVTAIHLVLKYLMTTSDWSPAAYSVTIFPLLVVGSFILWRISKILLIHSSTKNQDNTAQDSFQARLARTVAIGMLILAVATVFLGAVGYVRAAEALVMPALWTVTLIGGILVLQSFLVEAYILLTKNGNARETLFPVFTGIALFLLSLPIVAMFWGARMQDLEEVWNLIVQGFNVGGITISPTVFMVLISVFLLGYGLTRLLQGALRNTILPRTRFDLGGRNAIVSGTGYLGIFLSAVIAITTAGIDLSSLAIVAGALSVGIGFGLQNIVSNFVSGIILLIERPISEGDWIEVAGHQGYVRRISVRSTRIETFDRTDVIVPNSDFVSGAVTNYTRGNTIGRVIAPVGVAYGTDTKRVETLLLEIAQAHPMVLANPAPTVIFRGFGDNSLDFEIRAILRDVNWVMSVHSELNHEIARRFTEENIEIPFPQRDVWVRSAGPAAQPAPPEPPAAARKKTKVALSKTTSKKSNAGKTAEGPVRPTDGEGIDFDADEA